MATVTVALGFARQRGTAIGIFATVTSGLMALVPVPIDAVIRDALATGQVQYSAGMLEIGQIRQISDGFIAANYEPGTNITDTPWP